MSARITNLEGARMRELSPAAFRSMGEGGGLLAELLQEQQSLTAVERFAQKHAAASLPVQAKYYQDLIPPSKPGPGQQYAFEVTLDKCSGCKACVSACHSLNGLEEEETWRDVGTLYGRRGRGQAPYQQTVTTACHHCAEPGCLEGCPVMAYEKDAETGIVRHLDDQCIGCQYCTMKCPYGVPKYSERLGIVRKCDMCHERLAHGEAPACVQACPHEAITIRLVDVAEVQAAAQPGTQMLPGAFDSSYTKPSTRFVSEQEIPASARPADALHLRREHAHWPLITMLLLTQLAVGLLTVLPLVAGMAPEVWREAAFLLAALAFATLNAGLMAAVFHLGRPMGAWRFFLGLRTSWMSREILAFSIFAGAAASAVVGTFLISPWASGFRVALPILERLQGLVAWSTVAASVPLGWVAVFTSAMIYIDTRRPFWRGGLTLPKFFGGTLVLGLGGTTAVLMCVEGFGSEAPLASVPWFGLAAVVLQAALFCHEVAGYWRGQRPNDPIHLTALTLYRLLPLVMPARFILLALAGATLPMLWGGGAMLRPAAATLLCFALAASLLLERYTFFTAVVAPRMPGTK